MQQSTRRDNDDTVRPRRARRRLVSLVTVVILAAAGAVGAAVPAYADGPTGGTYAGAVDGTRAAPKIRFSDGEQNIIPTELIKLDFPAQNGADASTLVTYCVDAELGIKTSAPYHAQPWTDQDALSVSALRSINWIVGHAYPIVDLGGLLGNPTAPEAVEAAQLAIWHYSDGVSVVNVGGSVREQVVTDLYRYYIGPDNVGADEPAGPLSLGPSRTGVSGGAIGPFVVHLDSAGSASVSLTGVAGAPVPAGVQLTDASGQPVSTASDGDELYVRIAPGTPAGAVQIAAAGAAEMPAGTLLLGPPDLFPHPTQPLMLAEPETSGVSASATATWKAKAPVFTSADHATVSAGTTADIPISASGIPAPSITLDSEPPSGVGFVDNGDGTEDLTVGPSTAPGKYVLPFTASNAVEPDATTTVTLTVTQAPTVTTQPADVEAVAGSDARFTAESSGFPMPQVQWQLSTDAGDTWKDVEDATSATLTVPSVTLAQDGRQYRAVFTNSLGTATTDPATLTVYPPLRVTTSRLPDGTVGQPYRAVLTATGGADDAYTWTVENGHLPDGLTLAADGTISGTPTNAGTDTFTVSVNDPAVQELTLTVHPAAALASTGSDVRAGLWPAIVLLAGGLILLGSRRIRRGVHR